MKNLRRELKTYKKQEATKKPGLGRKSSEVANACEKLLPLIEDLFQKVCT